MFRFLGWHLNRATGFRTTSDQSRTTPDKSGAALQFSLSSRFCRFSFRPDRRKHQRNRNPNGYFRESVKGSLPCRIRPRNQLHDGQGNSRESIGAPVRSHPGAKQSQEQHADAEDQHVRPKVARDHRPHKRPQRRPKKSLPGHGKRRSQRRLCDDDGRNRRPVSFRKPEQPCRQHRS